MYHQLLLLFGDVELFLQRNDDVSAASRQKLLAIFQGLQKAALLRIELASIIDWGEDSYITMCLFHLGLSLQVRSSLSSSHG